MIVQVVAVDVVHPCQPTKRDPSAGLAVSVTCVPTAKVELQLAPQLMPTGLLVTMPLPAPTKATESAAGASKRAVTVRLAPSVTVQVGPELVSHPPQPVNTAPSAGLAVRVTWVPPVKLATQADPQLIPTGTLATVPGPDLFTVRLYTCGRNTCA